MTRNQAQWAAQHDWCKGILLSTEPEHAAPSNENFAFVAVRDFDEDNAEITRVFGRFHDLRAWAGY